MATVYNEDKFWEIANNAIFPYLRKKSFLDGGVYEIDVPGIEQQDIEWALNTMFENSIIQEGSEEGIYILTDIGKEFCPVQEEEAPVQPVEAGDEKELVRNMIFGTFIFYRQNPIKSTSIDLMKYKRGYEALNPKTKADVRRIEECIHQTMQELKDSQIVSIEEGSKENVDLNAPTIPDIVTLLDYESLPPHLYQEYEVIKPIMEREQELLAGINPKLVESYERDRKKIFMGKETAVYNEKLTALIDKYQAIMDRDEQEGHDELEFIESLPEELREEYKEKSVMLSRRNEHDQAQDKIQQLRDQYLEKAEELRAAREKKEHSLLFKTTHLFSKKKPQETESQ